MMIAPHRKHTYGLHGMLAEIDFVLLATVPKYHNRKSRKSTQFTTASASNVTTLDSTYEDVMSDGTSRQLLPWMRKTVLKCGIE
jgi:hypothetical protein